MHYNIRISSTVLFMLTLCTAALAQPPCSVQTIVGTWAASSQGTVFTTVSGNPVALPGAALGIASITYDGRVSVNLDGIIGGRIAKSASQGTVTVNPDCTGVFEAPTPIPGFRLKENFAIHNNGDELWTIAATGIQGNPAVWQCRWKRIAHVPLDLFQASSNCSADQLRGTWAGTFSGTVILPGMPVPVPTGILYTGIVDSQGAMSGTFTSSVGGQVAIGGYTGSVVEVKSDCTGTWKWKLKAADGTELPGEGIEKIVVLDGGKEVWSLGLQGVLGIPIGLTRLERLSPAIPR